MTWQKQSQDPAHAWKVWERRNVIEGTLIQEESPLQSPGWRAGWGGWSLCGQGRHPRVVLLSTVGANGSSRRSSREAAGLHRRPSSGTGAFHGSTGTFSRCVAPASSSASGSSLDILRLQQLGPELPSRLSASTNGDHFLPDFEKRKKKFLRAGRGLGSTCKSQSIVACPLLLRDQPVHRRLGAIELLCKHRGPQAATWPRAVEQTGVHTSLLGARGTAARPQPPGGPKESLLQKKISFMYS
eukprot:XP_022281707.1 uncharacterized protein LOC111098237 [Canis lupus familiaris]